MDLKKPLSELPANWKPKVRLQCNKCRAHNQSYEKKRLKAKAHDRIRRAERSFAIIPSVTWEGARDFLVYRSSFLLISLIVDGFVYTSLSELPIYKAQGCFPTMFNSASKRQ